MDRIPINPHKWFERISSKIVALYNGKSEDQGGSLLDGTLNRLLVTNLTLWRYEDEARRLDLPDKDIANLKRNIDKENQKRHDLVDYIDEVVQQDIEKKLKSIDERMPLNSETPGSIFDRLMVLALRAHNLKNETKRKDAEESHIEKCSSMLREVKERSKDLLNCLQALLEDYYSGRKRLKSYKQHKLYNDPKLNPALRK